MKRSFFSLLQKLRITRLAAWWNRQRVVILCYHGVTERSKRHPSDRYGLHIRADLQDSSFKNYPTIFMFSYDGRGVYPKIAGTRSNAIVKRFIVALEVLLKTLFPCELR